MANYGYGKCKVRIEEFNLVGSPGIIISPADVTKLLWRPLGFPRPYEIYVGETELPDDSFDLKVSGNCILERENYFKLDWIVQRTNITYQRQFSFEGEDLKLVRGALFSSLDSLTAPLVITTDPDSSGIIIDGIYRGEGPLNLDAFSTGWHSLEAKSPSGLEISDSFLLTRDSTNFHYTLVKTDTEAYSYVRLVTPPECELYQGLARKSPLKGDLYRFSPGEIEFQLVSRQYGIRDLRLLLEPGDTAEVGFFNHKKK